MTNKNDANKTKVLSALNGLRTALRNDPLNPAISAALEQCDRLEMAINQFHAEGLRFAAYTLLHMVQSGGTVFSERVRTATQSLKEVLGASGYPH